MIAIVDVCGANFTSIQCALERMGEKSILTHDANIIKSADFVILPGVGTAKQAMAGINKFGLAALLRELQQPVLGICLGMQIMYEYSEEGEVACLGILSGAIKKLTSAKNLIIPHMGWNQLSIINSDARLMNGIESNSYVYFVHSYCAPVSIDSVATTAHGECFSAAVINKNFYGVQFHPEKSGKVGEQVLRNFINRKGEP